MILIGAADPGLKLVDKLTIAAIVIGPAIAIAVQLWFEKRKERRRAKLEILDTLLAYRGRLVTPESVGALNRIQLAYYSDADVIRRHKALIKHLDDERSLPESEKSQGWQTRADLLTDLIASLASAVGYKFNHTDLKTTAYVPKGMTDENVYIMEIRKHLIALASGETSLKVKVEGGSDEF